MSAKLVIILLLMCGSLSTVTATFNETCIHCIGKVERGGSGCEMDVGSLSCGRYQIKEAYWIDCGKLGTGWKECACNITCAEQCLRNYMSRYEHDCKADLGKTTLSCEDYGRIHNGGPHGCRNPRTLAYVKAMRAKCHI